MKVWVAYNPIDDSTEVFKSKPGWWGSHKGWFGAYLGMLKENYPGLTYKNSPKEVEVSIEDVL